MMSCTSYLVVIGQREGMLWMNNLHLQVQRRPTLEGVLLTLHPHLRLLLHQIPQQACLCLNAPQVKARGRTLSWRSWDRLLIRLKNLRIPSTISGKKIKGWLHNVTNSCVQWWGQIISTTSSMKMKYLLLMIIL